MQVDYFISYDLKTWQNSKTWECQEERYMATKPLKCTGYLIYHLI
jgi:hypothetical protein